MHNRNNNKLKANSNVTDSGTVVSGNSNSVKFGGARTKDLKGLVLINILPGHSDHV